MAVSDKNLQDLTNAINNLVGKMNQRGSFGSQRDQQADRLGRSGLANSKSVQRQGDNVDALADSLVKLHQSMKGNGGRSIADHFDNLTKAMNPLKNAFENLEDVVENVAETQGKMIAEVAKAMKDFIVKNKGNVEEIKKANDAYTEYVVLVNQLVSIQKDKNRDEDAIKKALARELELRQELIDNGLFDRDAVTAQFAKYFTNLGKDPNMKAGRKWMEMISNELGEINTKYKAANGVLTTFLKDITKSVKDGQDAFDKAIKSFTGAVWSAAKSQQEISRVIGTISGRLRSGVNNYNIKESLLSGVSSAEFSAFQSENRSAINAITQFGRNGDIASDGRLRDWSNLSSRVGLTGIEAMNFTGRNMQTAYSTGRKFDADYQNNSINNTQFLQQAFGYKSVQEASDAWNDLSTQLSQVNRFNQANTEQEQATVDKELKARVALTKAMGLELDVMKQQDALRHNAQFADISSKIRGAIMGEMSGRTLGKQFGWTQEQQRVWSYSRTPGADLAQLSPEQQATLAEMQRQYGLSRNQRNLASSRGALANGPAGFIRNELPNVVADYALANSGGESAQTLAEMAITGQAKRRAQGNLSVNDVTNALNTNVNTLNASTKDLIGSFEQLALRASQIASGAGSMPGAGIAQAAISTGGSVLSTYIQSRFGLKALQSVFGKRGGAMAAGGGISGLFNKGKGLVSGLFSRGGGAAAGGAAGSVVTGGGGAGLATFGGRLLKGAKGGIPGLIGGVALDYGADAAGRDTKLGAGLDVASSALAWGGTGALIGSIIPGLGTAIGGGIGAAIGTGVGLWNNSETLLGKDMSDRMHTPEGIAMMLMGPMGLGLMAAMSGYDSLTKTTPNDAAANGASIGGYYDATNGIQRDANGNAIPTNPNDPVQQQLEVQRQMLATLQDTQKSTEERAERADAVEMMTSKSQQHQAALATTITQMF